MSFFSLLDGVCLSGIEGLLTYLLTYILCIYLNTPLFVHLQANLHELRVSIWESDPSPTRLVLYSNLPITCQDVASDNSPIYCWIKFTIRTTDDIAVRQRRPYESDPTDVKNLCIYQMDEADWKPHERRAYDGNKSLDILAKVRVSLSVVFLR